MRKRYISKLCFLFRSVCQFDRSRQIVSGRIRERDCQLNRRIVFHIKQSDEMITQSIQCASVHELNPNADFCVFVRSLNGHRQTIEFLC